MAWAYPRPCLSENMRIDPDGAFETSGETYARHRPLAGQLAGCRLPAWPDGGGPRARRGTLGPWRLADPLRYPAGRAGRAMRPDPERGSRRPLQRRSHRDRAENRRPEEQA